MTIMRRLIGRYNSGPNKMKDRQQLIIKQSVVPSLSPAVLFLNPLLMGDIDGVRNFEFRVRSSLDGIIYIYDRKPSIIASLTSNGSLIRRRKTASRAPRSWTTSVSFASVGNVHCAVEWQTFIARHHSEAMIRYHTARNAATVTAL